MNRIYFKSLTILSQQDKKGFSYTFSPNINIIFGENDTGKSSLIKNLYYTLGADLRLDPKWNKERIISKVVLHVRGTEYAFLRSNKRISIFNLTKNLEHIITSSHRAEIADKVKSIFNFNLELLNKKSSVQAQAYPACLYLPFYIDQDSGWSRVLESFDNLAMYNEWQKSILQFHTGIKPKEYYELQGEIKLIGLNLEELLATLKAIKSAQQRFEESFGRVLFDVDIDYYEELLQRFLGKCQSLNEEETEYRIKLLELLTNRDIVANEINECKAQLEDNQIDSISTSVQIDAKYQILENRDSLLKVIPDLYEQKLNFESEISLVKEKLRDSQKLSSELNEMLREIKGKLSLQDIIKSQASKQVESTFIEQISELNEKIGRLTAEQKELTDKRDTYTDSQRTKKINSEFKSFLQKAQDAIGIKDPTTGTITQYSKITRSETGSRSPRAIFAYHYGILKTIEKWSTIPMLPIVIDSPKQQDLDAKITRKLISLCTDDLASDNQLIIGSVSLEDNMHGFCEIELKNKYSLLNSEMYEEAYAKIIPFYKQSIRVD